MKKVMKKLLVSLIVVFVMIFALIGCGKSQQIDSKNSGKEIPQIPHKMDNKMVCAECHKDGKNKAKATKHFDRPNCTQCHKFVKN